MLILAGWGGREVRLLGSEKLIDLDKAIALAKPGGMAGDTEEASETAEDAGDEKEDGENDGAQQDGAVSVKNIVIRIRGEQIFYTCGGSDSGIVSDSQLSDRIRADYVQGAQVILMDDFAEAHVYRNVLGILEDLKTDIGLSYKEDRFAGGE